MHTEIKFLEAMSFETNTRGHKIIMDTVESTGGQNKGMTPKEMVLNGVCGCSAMDVISILRKMRQMPDSFNVTAEAEKTTTTPSYFSKIHLQYLIDGKVEKDNAVKAVTLSMTKYCGVSYMISQTTEISYDIILNGENVFTGFAEFVDV